MSFGKATVKIPLKVNKLTGKESSAVSTFSEQNCGPRTRLYAIAIDKRDDAALHDIVAGATALIPYSMDAVSEEGSLQYEDNIDNLIAALCWSINGFVMVCLHTYISIHRTTVVSITIVPQ